MRQFFTLRFWLTLLALGALVLGVLAFARSRESVDNGSSLPDAAAGSERTIDLVSWIYSVQTLDGFKMIGGKVATDVSLVLDGTRTMVLKAGTPGVVDCPKLTELAQCTVAADLLGDAVLWFSIVPGKPGATVQLPAATEVLDGGWVRLANGWLVQHAPIVDRSCAEETGSLSDFIDTYGTDATSTFNFEQQQIQKVTCPRAPGTSTTSTTSTTLFIDPSATLDPTATSRPAESG